MAKKVLRATSLALVVTLMGMNIGSTTVFAEGTEQRTEEISYAEGVVTDMDSDYSVEDTTAGIRVTTQDENTAQELQEGDILILPADGENETERAIEVTAVTDTAEGYVIEGTEPESFSDVVEHVDVEGETSANISEIVTEEGVRMQTRPAGRSLGLGTSGSTELEPLRFWIDRSFGEYGSIQGSITMTPTLEYRLLVDLGGVKELELGMRGRVETENLSVNCQADGVIPIATIPYTFADGMFTAYVTVQVAYTAGGEAFLTYAMDGYCGMNYDGVNTNFVCDYVPETLEYGLGAYGNLEANLSMGLVAYGTFTLMDVEVNAGVSAESRVYDTEEMTDFAELYFYLNGNYGYNSVLKEYGVYGSKVIFDRDNSPLKYEVEF